MTAGDMGFKGSMPEFYDRYMGPINFAPFAAEMAARVAALRPARVLETACGTGIVTYAMAEALPENAEIVATDLSQPMVDFAAAKEKRGNITWRQADAQALPFPDASFDAVVCQFGAMFFPDKLKAYGEARRVLRDGGRFLFTVWDRLERHELSHTNERALAALFPHDPPSFQRRVPFGYHDPAAIDADLRAAGFRAVTVDAVQKELAVANARDPAIGLCQGTPVRTEIEARDPGGVERATEALARAIEARFGPGPFRPKAQALLVTAEG